MQKGYTDIHRFSAMGFRFSRSKGVVGDCESEGSWRQNSGLTDRNHIEAVNEGKTAIL